jgi:hypothetical protein
MATRYIIGKGELLAYGVPPPKTVPDKYHPYTLDQAKEAIGPELDMTSAALDAGPASLYPHELAVAKLTLHPVYVAKSYFPAGFLMRAGLVSVGSRTVRIKPRKPASKRAPKQSDTVQLFVAGTREAFRRLPNYARSLTEADPEANDFIEIEAISPFESRDRIAPGATPETSVFEVGLHLMPHEDADNIRMPFIEYAASCGFKIPLEHEFQIGGLLFLAAEGDQANIERLARFSLMRVVRPMPALRGARPLQRAAPLAVTFQMPSGAPLSSEPKAAILDGGLPEDHVFERYINRYRLSDDNAAASPEYVDHGHGVTSAFLFGPIEPGQPANRPYSYVDHYRVLDVQTGQEDPFELYRTLGHVEEILLSRQYQFINLSLGPDLPVEDTEVHPWTAVIDSILGDSDTLLTVAAGNNGLRDRELRLDRIQVPADSVNAISVGSADHTSALWQRADYSARGPGRSPGRRKPDVMAFGGSPREYFHVAAPGNQPQLAATLGTSFAAPYVLRTAVGVRAILGSDIHPLTIKALLIHGCESGNHPEIDVGWGRVPSDLNQIITCHDGMARIIYQGSLYPRKFLRAPIPLPPYTMQGDVRLTATFCYSTKVDPQDSSSYTRAGLGITFRPHEDRKERTKDGKQATYATSKPFFPSSQFRTELEQRADLGKWEPVLHASHRFRGNSLKGSVFDVHYNARERGANTTNAEVIRYALVLTVLAPRHTNIYQDILDTHTKLQALESQIAIPVSGI